MNLSVSGDCKSYLPLCFTIWVWCILTVLKLRNVSGSLGGLVNTQDTSLEFWYRRSRIGWRVCIFNKPPVMLILLVWGARIYSNSFTLHTLPPPPTKSCIFPFIYLFKSSDYHLNLSLMNPGQGLGLDLGLQLAWYIDVIRLCLWKGLHRIWITIW